MSAVSVKRYVDKVSTINAHIFLLGWEVNMKRKFFCFFLGMGLFSSVCFLQTAAAQQDFPDLLADDFYDDSLEDTEDYPETVYDPLEPMNRMFFTFNDLAFEWVLDPALSGYAYIVPEELRICVDNFFSNLSSPLRFVHSLLQGEFEQSGIVLKRFLINSTAGVYGLVDVASQEYGMAPQKADFGQTLGRWGLGEGPYLYWPVLGPSNLRDTVGLAADSFAIYSLYFYDNSSLDLTQNAVDRLNMLSLKKETYKELKKFSLDPYAASRQAYLDYRRAFIDRKLPSREAESGQDR